MIIVIEIIRKKIGIIGMILFLTGMFFSKALLSISVALIFLQPFFTYKPSELFKRFLQNRHIVLFAVFYAIIIITWFNTEDKQGYLIDCWLKLPLLLIPVGMVWEKWYSKRTFVTFIMILNGLVFTVGIMTFAHYLYFFDEINLLILQSKPVPIYPSHQIGHIYFGFIQAFSIISGAVFYVKKLPEGYWKKINILSAIGSLILIHIIGSRTGLLAFYCSAFVLLIFAGMVLKKYWLSLLFILGMIILGIVSTKFIPSLHNRYSNTMIDLKHYYNKEDINYYSISMRIAAWEKTIEVIKDNFWFGVGYADTLHEIKDRYKEEGSTLKIENQKEPHNQFLEVFAATGIFGFLMFVYLFFYPLIRIVKQKDPLALGLMIIMFVTFCIESALEMEAGVCFFALIWILVNSIEYWDEKENHKLIVK